MNIQLIAVGQKMPHWVEQAYQDYSTRLPSNLKLHLKEIPLQKRLDAKQTQALRQKEDEQILKLLQQNDHCVALDIPGKEYNSEELAKRLEHWQNHHQKLALLIGGPEGISANIKNHIHEFWSLGKLTYPHPLVRVIVAEALYRAWSITQNHPYHRA